MNTNELHAQYLDLGYSPIPLKPSSKLPLVNGWQVKPTVRQWYKAPNNANIGLRAGNERAFIDCDDKNHPGTFEAVTRWLDGLGYHPGDYPVIQTASGVGRHIYVNWAGAMLGSSRSLSRDLGAGEFRFDYGAYVAAPPSTTEGGAYTLIDGDLLHLPVLDLRDISQIVSVNETAPAKQPQMSRKAVALANGNAEVIGKYPSRSEAEAALVLSLINSGFDYPAIKSIFDGLPCAGKYAELPHQHKAGYLERTYKNALTHSQNESDTRKLIRRLQAAAELTAWKNASDKHVFIAHTEIAYQTGKLINAAACRDLAIIAGVEAQTVSRANRRLVAEEFLSLEAEGTANLAHKFTLRDKVLHSLTYSLRECNGLSQNRETPNGDRIATHDAFRNGKHRLGRRAGQVYELLYSLLPDGLTEQEIAEQTGAHVKTIRRTLKRLANVKDRRTGEFLPLVSSSDGEFWTAEIVDLELIAAIYHTYGAREEQRERYEQERREHAKSLELGASQQ